MQFAHKLPVKLSDLIILLPSKSLQGQHEGGGARGKSSFLEWNGGPLIIWLQPYLSCVITSSTQQAYKKQLKVFQTPFSLWQLAYSLSPLPGTLVSPFICGKILRNLRG